MTSVADPDILADQFNVDPVPQQPCDRCVPQAVRHDFLIPIVRGQPGRRHDAVKARLDLDDRLAVVLHNRQPGDAEPVPAMHMRQQAGRERDGWLAFTGCFLVVRLAFENTPIVFAVIDVVPQADDEREIADDIVDGDEGAAGSTAYQEAGPLIVVWAARLRRRGPRCWSRTSRGRLSRGANRS